MPDDHASADRVAGGWTPPAPRDTSSPLRFLIWLARSQAGRVAAGAALGSSWMVGLAVPPWVLSRAVDDGLVAGNTAALVTWSVVLFPVGVLNAVLAISRHRTMTKIRMDASFRTVRAVVRHTARLGSSLSRRVGTGEVVTIGIADVQTVAQSMTVTGPGFGAVVAYAAVAVVLFTISPLLALVVLAGVPLLAAGVGPLLRRVERTGGDYRVHQGRLTTRLVDVLGGLRVLNGLGGKEFAAERYGRQSRELVERGYRVGGPASWVTASASGLPALFLAVVVWLAARMTARGEITIGDLVAVYGYVAVLVVPVSFFIEGGGDIARALVAARRITDLLNLRPEHEGGDRAAVDVPAGGGPLADPASGVLVRPGLLTALVSARPEEAIAVVERLGRLTDTDATWSGVRVDAVSVDRLRERLIVADNDAELFAGTVRDTVAGRHEPDDERVRAAVRTAVAEDVVEALPGGLDAPVASGGSTLSGGQRQRLRLARALYAAPDVLLAVEPTSAVDAHTEATVVDRLREVRRGLTTVVTTTSPLVLDRADEVVFLADGRAAASGAHQELLRDNAAYRDLVSRVQDGEVGR
ncbi:ABC transporter ATP-binding protein [Saccharothrix longispora]|uniref:ABC-type multidrug transport system fused ATPase/permease subunit n=1 Tax=Saccharothrix longispora TaxID=33920 RepID=A0ABU1PPJ4_9PSEU|nr:ABC transporter ATP-binding protein [Saccharothrix longispora]MDR6592592.1 ABC-type multidrug transport system fused ATPase/permease subunit [Saccharothrix longispora]